MDGMPTLRQLCVATDAAKPPLELAYPPFCQPLPSHFRHAQRAAQQLPFPATDIVRVSGGEVRIMETFHKVFLHLDDFQEKSRFSTWLTRIAINESLILLRRKRRIAEVLPESPEDGVESISEAFVDQSPSPEESCWRRERTELLAETINRLGPKVRSAVLLRDIEERSAEETAELLGTAITAAKARVLQWRRKLRGMVNPAILLGVSTAVPTEHTAADI